MMKEQIKNSIVLREHLIVRQESRLSFNMIILIWDELETFLGTTVVDT